MRKKQQTMLANYEEKYGTEKQESTKIRRQ